MMASFQIGFGEVDITPAEPLRLAGYYYERISTSTHDPLSVRCMAVSDGTTRAALCVADLLYPEEASVAAVRRRVAQETGLPETHLILSAVHTHTAPLCPPRPADRRPEEAAYMATLPAKLAAAVKQALDDLAPAELRIGRGEERTLQFIRRFRMRDGSVRTNPGIMNPDVVEALGTPDRDIFALLATVGGKAKGALVDFGLHCDTVGGTEISADWTHYLRLHLQERLGAKAAILTPIGCCGDVNHWDVRTPADSGARGFALTEKIGRTIGEAAWTALERAEPVHAGPVRALRRTLEARTRMPSEQELAQAKALMATPAPQGLDFTMDRVEARRCIRVADFGSVAKLDLTVLSFGDVALVAVPAEYFSELGRDIKARSPFRHTILITLAERTLGYIGARHNYAEGGYEMTSSLFAPGAGEQIAETAVAMLKEIAPGG